MLRNVCSCLERVRWYWLELCEEDESNYMTGELEVGKEEITPWTTHPPSSSFSFSTSTVWHGAHWLRRRGLTGRPDGWSWRGDIPGGQGCHSELVQQSAACYSDKIWLLRHLAAGEERQGGTGWVAKWQSGATSHLWQIGIASWVGMWLSVFKPRLRDTAMKRRWELCRCYQRIMFTDWQNDW